MKKKKQTKKVKNMMKENITRAVKKRVDILLEQNKKLLKKGNISRYHLNCKELKGIEFVLEKL